jgi:S-disulfanyl-L-cysteine oxidoreductase SoxD
MRRLAIPAATLGLYLVVTVSALQAGQAASGSNVWSGVFTAEQAKRGGIQYSANCAGCHGANLQGGEGKALAGDQFWSDWREQTVDALLSYISKNMPYSEDGSLAGTLAPNVYADIVAHVLGSNGLPVGSRELTAASSVGIRIIRKDGPGALPASTLARVVGCLAPRAADGSWKLVKGTQPERVSGNAAAAESNVPLGDREYQLKFVLTSLTNFVGHRMVVTGLLLGDGGVEGINVSSAKSVSPACN